MVSSNSHLGRSTLHAVICIVVSALSGSSRADEANFSVGVLHVEFASREAAPDLEPVAVLRAAGIRTEILANYDEQKNIDGAIEAPALLAKSGKAPGRWCDVVVPFSTEQFWIESIKRLDGVTDVRRKPAHAVRGSETAQQLSIEQGRIDSVQAPSLEFSLHGPQAESAINELFAFCKTYYGVEGGELYPEGKPRDRRFRTFLFNGLHEKLFADPPWQRLRIAARLELASAGESTTKTPTEGKITEQSPTATLRLVFFGGGAYGSRQPPEAKYESLLAREDVAGRFGEHVERFGAALEEKFIAQGLLTK